MSAGQGRSGASQFQTKKKHLPLKTKQLPKRLGLRVWGSEFLSVLAQTCNVSLACRKVGISRRTVYYARQNHAEFAEQWDEAVAEGKDILLAEAHRRIMNGTKEVTYDEHGKVVRTVHKYSDTMLIFMLKGYFPELFKNAYAEEESRGPQHTYVENVEISFVDTARDRSPAEAQKISGHRDNTEEKATQEGS